MLWIYCDFFRSVFLRLGWLFPICLAADAWLWVDCVRHGQSRFWLFSGFSLPCAVRFFGGLSPDFLGAKSDGLLLIADCSGGLATDHVVDLMVGGQL